MPASRSSFLAENWRTGLYFLLIIPRQVCPLKPCLQSMALFDEISGVQGQITVTQVYITKNFCCACVHQPVLFRFFVFVFQFVLSGRVRIFS